MLSEEYFGFRNDRPQELRSHNRIVLHRTELSLERMNRRSKSKQNQNRDLELTHQKLLELRSKYVGKEFSEKQDSYKRYQLRQKSHSRERSRDSFRSNFKSPRSDHNNLRQRTMANFNRKIPFALSIEYKFRSSHYYESGAQSIERMRMHRRIQRNALNALDKCRSADPISPREACVSQSLLQLTKQRISQRNSHKGYLKYSKQTQKMDKRSFMNKTISKNEESGIKLNNSGRKLRKLRPQQKQQYRQIKRTSNDEYYIRTEKQQKKARGSKQLQYSSKESLMLGTMPFTKKKSITHLDNKNNIEQLSESHISVNSKKKIELGEVSILKSSDQNKHQDQIDNNPQPQIQANHYGNDWERIKELERQARLQSNDYGKQKEFNDIYTDESALNGRYYDSSVNKDVRQSRESRESGESKSNPLSNLIKNSSNIVKVKINYSPYSHQNSNQESSQVLDIESQHHSQQELQENNQEKEKERETQKELDESKQNNRKMQTESVNMVAPPQSKYRQSMGTQLLQQPILKDTMKLFDSEQYYLPVNKLNSASESKNKTDESITEIQSGNEKKNRVNNFEFIEEIQNQSNMSGEKQISKVSLKSNEVNRSLQKDNGYKRIHVQEQFYRTREIKQETQHKQNENETTLMSSIGKKQGKRSKREPVSQYQYREYVSNIEQSNYSRTEPSQIQNEKCDYQMYQQRVQVFCSQNKGASQKYQQNIVIRNQYPMGNPIPVIQKYSTSSDDRLSNIHQSSMSSQMIAKSKIKGQDQNLSELIANHGVKMSVNINRVFTKDEQKQREYNTDKKQINKQPNDYIIRIKQSLEMQKLKGIQKTNAAVSNNLIFSLMSNQTINATNAHQNGILSLAKLKQSSEISLSINEQNVQKLNQTPTFNHPLGLSVSGSFPHNPPYSLSKNLQKWNEYEQNQFMLLFSENSSVSLSDRPKNIEQRLYDYLSIMKKIIDYISDTEVFYTDYQQRKKLQPFSYYLLCYFYENRQRFLLRMGMNTDIWISGLQIRKGEINPIKQSVQKLTQIIITSNRSLYKILQQFYSYLKISNDIPKPPLKATSQLTKVVSMNLNNQLEVIIRKIDQNQEIQLNQFIKDNQNQSLSLRGFCIMELLFLISELEGKKTKKLEESFEPSDFKDYCKVWYGLFKQAVLGLN